MTAEVNAELAAEGCTQHDGSPCRMRTKDFTGLPILMGVCYDAYLEEAKRWLEHWALGHNRTAVAHFLARLEASFVGVFGNEQQTATKVVVQSRLDPFSRAGQQWLRAVRRAVGKLRFYDDGTLLPHHAVEIGEWHFSGMALEQMDASQETFDALPRVMAATLAIVCLVLLLAFRSLLVPLRAVLCLTWMLVVTFGAAVLVYQDAADSMGPRIDGVLSGLGVGALTPSGGAMFWMTPCVAFSIVVGLGLDYDVPPRTRTNASLAPSTRAVRVCSHLLFTPTRSSSWSRSSSSTTRARRPSRRWSRRSSRRGTSSAWRG